MKKVLLASVFAIVTIVVGLACYAWARTDQTRNSIKLQEYAQVLKRHRADVNRYPSEVSGNDYYRFPLLYFTDGREYILVGVGRDGKPDFEYSLNSLPLRKEENCLSPSRDTVVVSGRVVVGCLK